MALGKKNKKIRAYDSGGKYATLLCLRFSIRLTGITLFPRTPLFIQVCGVLREPLGKCRMLVAIAELKTVL